MPHCGTRLRQYQAEERHTSAGIQTVRAAGGITIAQDQASSDYSSMPRTAIATGDVDFVLPLSETARALVTLLTSPT